MPTRTPVCRAKNHTGSGCDDPRCPQRVYMAGQLQQAVAAGSIESLLAARPTLPGLGVSAEEFFNELSATAQRALLRKLTAEQKTEKPELIGLSLRPSELRYREQLLTDLQRDAKLKVDPKTGRKRVSIYRSGVPVPPQQRGAEADSYTAADAVAPAGRIGRTSGLFASASIDTGIRWLRGNHMVGMEDVALREMTVDPDTTYIYCVSNWERVSSAQQSGNAEGARAATARFWSESMTLSQWYAYVEANPAIDTRDWEILVRPEDVQSIKPVSWKRIIEGSFRGETRQLIDMQQREQREKRWAREAQARRA